MIWCNFPFLGGDEMKKHKEKTRTSRDVGSLRHMIMVALRCMMILLRFRATVNADMYCCIVTKRAPVGAKKGSKYIHAFLHHG